jgi:hypothetical protein
MYEVTPQELDELTGNLAMLVTWAYAHGDAVRLTASYPSALVEALYAFAVAVADREAAGKGVGEVLAELVDECSFDIGPGDVSVTLPAAVVVVPAYLD